MKALFEVRWMIGMTVLAALFAGCSGDEAREPRARGGAGASPPIPVAQAAAPRGCGGARPCAANVVGGGIAGSVIAHSPSYSGVFSFGQVPGSHSLARSSSYRLDGGIIGVVQNP